MRKIYPLLFVSVLSLFALNQAEAGKTKSEKAEMRGEIWRGDASKSQHESIAAARRAEAEKYKKDAENEKGDLAVALYTLAQSCNEEASLREKIADAKGVQPATVQAYKARIDSLIDRVKSLKEKVAAMGYTGIKTAASSPKENK